VILLRCKGMCGRYTLTIDKSTIGKRFSVEYAHAMHVINRLY